MADLERVESLAGPDGGPLPWLALVSLAFLAFPAPVGPRAAPLEAYGRLPAMEDVRLSPDGARLAYVATDGERRTLVVQELAHNTIIAALRVGERKLRSVQWAGDNHLILTTSTTGRLAGVRSTVGEWTVASDYNIAKHAQHALLGRTGTGSDHDVLNVTDGVPMVRILGGKPFAFVQGARVEAGAARAVLFKVDLDNDDVSLVVAEGSPDTRRYLVDAAGAPLAASEYSPAQGRWTLSLWRDGAWRSADHVPTLLNPPELLGLGRDGGSALVAFDGEETGVFREYDPAKTSWGQPFAEGDRLIRDPADERLIGVETLIGDERRYTFFEPGDQAMWRAVAQTYSGAGVSLVAMSRNHQTIVARVDSPTDGPSFALVDVKRLTSQWIGAEYDGLKPEDISGVRAVSFKARDGLPLSGYLTLPHGREPKRLPLIVIPHGGPAARDEPGFDWWSQAMASRGYAVLRVNYRGSAGLGGAFQAAGLGQWGRRMQTDLSDGVRYLVGQGEVDPARVCIVGASYGGYAALAGVSQEPDVYRCAASVAGPSDLAAFVGWARRDAGAEGAAAARYWRRYMGAQDGLTAISPAAHARAISAPVLLIHGRDDTVVPFFQSRIMADALRRAGKTVELVALNGEDHWMSRGETRLEMLKAVVAFLEKNNPP